MSSDDKGDHSSQTITPAILRHCHLWEDKPVTQENERLPEKAETTQLEEAPHTTYHVVTVSFKTKDGSYD